MPGLVRKLLIIAAVDGLILQPHGNAQRNASNGHHAIQIQYKTKKITSLSSPSSPSSPSVGPSLNEDKREEGDGKSKQLRKDAELEAHGVVGECFSSRRGMFCEWRRVDCLRLMKKNRANYQLMYFFG